MCVCSKVWGKLGQHTRFFLGVRVYRKSSESSFRRKKEKEEEEKPNLRNLRSRKEGKENKPEFSPSILSYTFQEDKSKIERPFLRMNPIKKGWWFGVFVPTIFIQQLFKNLFM